MNRTKLYYIEAFAYEYKLPVIHCLSNQVWKTRTNSKDELNYVIYEKQSAFLVLPFIIHFLQLI
ncbi:MAG: hypothetical protein WCJ01_08305 [Ignavibacteria bacterium]